MRYPIKGRNTIFDLLSANNAGRNACQGRGDKIDLHFMQAFHDAGNVFEVIDTYTKSVLVPYEDGESLIPLFDGKAADKKNFFREMKQAQQYAVNLFSYEIQRLEAWGAVWRTESGVIALRKEYYSENFGVQLEEQQNDYCMV